MADSNLQQELRELLSRLEGQKLALDEQKPDFVCFLSSLSSIARLSTSSLMAHKALLSNLMRLKQGRTEQKQLLSAQPLDFDQTATLGDSLLRAVDLGFAEDITGLLITDDLNESKQKLLYLPIIGKEAKTETCDWWWLRARSEWATPEPATELSLRGLRTWVDLGGKIVVAVDSLFSANRVYRQLASQVAFELHTSFRRILPEAAADSSRVALWPMEAIEEGRLEKEKASVLITLNAPVEVQNRLEDFMSTKSEKGRLEWVEASLPGIASRDELAAYWKACGYPKVYLPTEASSSVVDDIEEWLCELGAKVVRQQPEKQQLGLF